MTDGESEGDDCDEVICEGYDKIEEFHVDWTTCGLKYDRFLRSQFPVTRQNFQTCSQKRNSSSLHVMWKFMSERANRNIANQCQKANVTKRRRARPRQVRV